MDTAKVADAVFTHGGTAREQEGFFLMPRDDDDMGRPHDIAPLACIPTTAGTGSEVSMAAVIKEPDERIKLEIADFPLFPRLAILDPETTRTLPAAVAAATGMDAMTHAVEGYVSQDWSPHQDARSLQALRMIRDNLERAVQGGERDEEARGNMLIAANLAITLALGSVHAMSHPAGAQFGVPHGVANAIHLPHVIRFNARGGDSIAERYREIGDLLGLETGGAAVDAADALADHVGGLVERLGLPPGSRRRASPSPAFQRSSRGRWETARRSSTRARPARRTTPSCTGARSSSARRRLGALGGDRLPQHRLRRVLRPPAELAARSLRLHEDRLLDGVDPGDRVGQERQPRDDVGRGVRERLRHRDAVPVECPRARPSG